MRTRLARLLLAAARRLDREGSVVPEGATRSVEVRPLPKPDLERLRAEVDRMAGIVARSQDLPEEIFRRPRLSAGPVAGFGDADLAEGDVVTIDLPGRPAFRHRVTRVEHDGTVSTEPLGPA